MTTERSTLAPIAGAFVLYGAFAGAWAVSVLDITRTFDLSDTGLGVMLAIGILFAAALNAIGGALTDRWGPDLALARSLLIWSALLFAVAGAPALGWFAVAFTLTTAAGGLVDVVMNVVSAAALSAEPGRLVRFHALFNVGCVLGASVAGVALELGSSWRIVFAVLGAFGLVLVLLARKANLPDPPRVDHPSVFRAIAGLRHEGLVVLAIVFAASAMVEGGIATWGVLYLRDHLAVGVLAGVGAYVVGQGLAAVTRSLAGPMLGTLGIRRGVAIGAGVSAFGIALEALTTHAFLGATGLALACIGISVVWPLLLAEVNNEARHPALAIGGVSAAGYLGMVAGPPIVGVLSGAFDLTTGLIVLAAVALFVAVTPAHVRASARSTR